MAENVVMGPLDAQELMALLKVRYPAPSWALIPQVGDKTGGWNRCADAIGISCWPCLGLAVHGFEIKSHRGDWLREVNDGEKSQAIFRYCDHWWIVVGNDQIVQPGELPPTWGLLVAKGGKLHLMKAAPPLAPEPLTKTFIASVLRGALEVVVPDAALNERYKAGYAEGNAEGERVGEHTKKRLREELENTQSAIRAFEKATGVKFPDGLEFWKKDDEAAQVGEAVRLVLGSDRGKAFAELMKLQGRAKEIVALVDLAIAEAREAIPAAPKKYRKTRLYGRD